MTIEWTPEIKLKLDLLVNAGVRATGFILGTRIGKITVMEDVLLVPFHQANLKDIFRSTSRRFGERLMGIIFCNTDMVKETWMMEIFFLHIQKSDIHLFQYADDGTLKQLKNNM